MSWLRIVWTELFGLFVDDGRFALLILGWLAVCIAALPRLPLPAHLSPCILFAGLVVILLENATRRARRASASTAQ